MKSLSAIFVIMLLGCQNILSQSSGNETIKTERMEWFKNAKLGIFIHWGIYSVNGIDESWSFYNKYISYEDYMRQLNGFTASKYDPDHWAQLIKESGAKYAVLTSKHHDGVALWDTKLGNLNVVDKTSAGRDLIAPFVNSLRKNGLKVGLYYSLLDWSHPDYDGFLRDRKKYENDSTRWKSFTEFNMGQIRELSTRFNPDLFWFDGDWEHTADEWKATEIRKMLLKKNPGVIINSRLQGYGDYSTPEQGVPIVKPEADYWELCMTINNSWGYQPNDSAYKSPNQVIRILVDCISMGGNLLLDIGPKEDGTIPEPQLEVLKELGRWTNKHKEAVYGTRAGISKSYFYGPTALSNDSTVLYLYLDYIPRQKVVIKGLKNKVNRVWVVGNGTKLNYEVVGKAYWSPVPGLLYVEVPEAVLDPQVTVLAILLDGKIELYGQNDDDSNGANDQ